MEEIINISVERVEEDYGISLIEIMISDLLESDEFE